MSVGKGPSFLLIFLAAVALADNTPQSKRLARSSYTPVSVIFTSLSDAFTTDLLSPSSAAFKKRSQMIEDELGPKFNSSFPSYNAASVELFRNGQSGSVINEMKLSFDSTNVPSNPQIATVMINASRAVRGFDIQSSSISVNGFVSSGIAHSSSLLTASCLTLLSYVLSRQH